ncbi:MAG TPA: serine/threonine-protein kinase [Verrucomicrobiales bacterium]|nr:serine/threonine protein kinase [Verrucomicrobiae bacterium]HRX52991.1 serine/threonine-protein kinase [Verrucomicrobiales bacterium]
MLSPEELAPYFPQYDILGLLGRGGMGSVYLARQNSLSRLVAIKVLSAELVASSPHFAERFRNEAKILAMLSHPGIVNVHDFGETSNGLFFIIMEYIEGTDVQQLLQHRGRLHSAETLNIIARVCDALIYAHSRGVIHLDIKPSNIMVAGNGTVKVADFGLAKINHTPQGIGLTRERMSLGTPHFMAPEVLVNETNIDHRADLYSLGVTLYQMLTGKLPQGMFEMPSFLVPGIDPRYDGIVAKALREDRDVRYQNASDLRRDLDAVVTQPIPKAETLNESTGIGGAAEASITIPIARNFIESKQELIPSLPSTPALPQKQAQRRKILGWGVFGTVSIASFWILSRSWFPQTGTLEETIKPMVPMPFLEEEIHFICASAGGDNPKESVPPLPVSTPDRESLIRFLRTYFLSQSNQDSAAWAEQFAPLSDYCYGQGSNMTTRSYIQSDRKKLVDHFSERRYDMLKSAPHPSYAISSDGQMASLNFGFRYSHSNETRHANGIIVQELKLRRFGSGWQITGFNETVQRD